MASDNPVLVARSALANVVRHSGDPEAIAEARKTLKIAKAERLRADADALLVGLDRDTVRVVGYADPTGPSREDHAALLQWQHEEAEQFKAEHDAPSGWTDEDRTAWRALLDRQTKAHEALGCAKTAHCRMARG